MSRLYSYQPERIRDPAAPRIPRHVNTAKKMDEAERQERIERAHKYAARHGTSLVDALKMEGVL